MTVIEWGDRDCETCGQSSVVAHVEVRRIKDVGNRTVLVDEEVMSEGYLCRACGTWTWAAEMASTE